MLWCSIPMEAIYMSQVKVTNKKSGITYVYESESYWDKEKKQPRNKRKLIGKTDPETGEIIPTRNHVSDMPNAGDLPASAAELKKLCHSYEKKLSRQDEKIQMLNDELSRMKLEKKALLQKLKELVNEFNS